MTSALPGEGKSTTAANIAIALAQTGARTLLIDLDMRKPMLASVLEVSSETGHEHLSLGQLGSVVADPADELPGAVRGAGGADRAQPGGADRLEADARRVSSWCASTSPMS